MHDNPILDAIRTRRSIRRFTDRPVDPELVRAVLEAGRFAPSGLNNQPWRFLVVRAGEPRQGVLAAHTKYAHVVNRAAALLCLFLDRRASYHAAKDQQGLGACAQNMLLAAHSLGLGAVWLGEIINQEPRVTQALDLDPSLYELAAVLALGWPDQQGSSDRAPLESLMIEPLPDEEPHAG